MKSPQRWRAWRRWKSEGPGVRTQAAQGFCRAPQGSLVQIILRLTASSTPLGALQGTCHPPPRGAAEPCILLPPTRHGLLVPELEMWHNEAQTQLVLAAVLRTVLLLMGCGPGKGSSNNFSSWVHELL